MKTTIVNVDPCTPVTCVELVGVDTSLWVSGAWAVHIKRVNPQWAKWSGAYDVCGNPLPHWNRSCGCGPRSYTTAHAQLHGIQDCYSGHNPTLAYPVHEVDADGRVCFHWDSLLYSQRPGRYKAWVKDKSGTVLGEFEIALTRHRSHVTSAHSHLAHCC